jgi:hypothetical protein
MAHCPNCGGELKIIAAIMEQPVIEKILTHLGLQARVPPHQGLDCTLCAGRGSSSRQRNSYARSGHNSGLAPAAKLTGLAMQDDRLRQRGCPQPARC